LEGIDEEVRLDGIWFKLGAFMSEAELVVCLDDIRSIDAKEVSEFVSCVDEKTLANVNGELRKLFGFGTRKHTHRRVA
jgi:hypothetical protein